MSTSATHRSLRIKNRLSCPHCWQTFPIEQLLFISESPDLPADSKLPSEPLRFLPRRFNIAGAALDPRNAPCEKVACPECHLQIPHPWLYLNNFFVSIAGAPASGKSYFLASMTWRLRKTLAHNFHTSFADVDPHMNRRIFEYETALFTGSKDPHKLVRIDKTDVGGDIYNNTIINGTLTQLAQPFTYTTEPMPKHPLLHKANRTRQVICVYDNAGEHFLPGADHITAPVTRHMAKSNALLFIFDPTQDVRFRAACTEQVNDPQMNSEIGTKSEIDSRLHSVRQETVLINILRQIRNLTFLPPHEKIKIPLIVVLTKYDAWQQLGRGKFPKGKAPEEQNPWKMTAGGEVNVYRSDRVEKYSQILRTLLLDLIPDIVAAAESAVEKVTYVAVSATGGPPELGEPDAQGIRPLCYRPINVKPIWTEVPFLHAQFLANKSTVPYTKDGKAVM
jgi:hypothetical protein